MRLTSWITIIKPRPVALVAQRPIVVNLSRGRSVGLSIRKYVRTCVGRSVCPVHCGKTADRIRMPFGIVGRTGPGMGQVAGFGDPSMGRDTFGANLGRAIVTNGNFTAYVCDSAATRPSSQINLGRLVVELMTTFCSEDVNKDDSKFTNDVSAAKYT